MMANMCTSLRIRRSNPRLRHRLLSHRRCPYPSLSLRSLHIRHVHLPKVTRQLSIALSIALGTMIKHQRSAFFCWKSDGHCVNATRYERRMKVLSVCLEEKVRRIIDSL